MDETNLDADKPLPPDPKKPRTTKPKEKEPVPGSPPPGSPAESEPHPREDGRCLECERNQAQTRDGLLCIPCLRRWAEQENELEGMW